LFVSRLIFRKNVEDFITQFKNNRFVRYSVLSGFVLLAYLLGGAVAIPHRGVRISSR